MTTIYNADCLTILKDMPDESIDMVMTSPPYDNLRTYNGAVDQWNFDKFKAIAKEIARILVRGGVCVWVVNDTTINGSETGSSFRQALYFKDECKMNIHDTMIWKKMGCRFPETNRYYPNFEYMFVLSKGKPKTTNLIQDRININSGQSVKCTERQPDGSLKKSHGSVIGTVIKDIGVRFNVWTMKEAFNDTGHPAIYPVSLAVDHILTWSNEGDTVLDPFLGSGTTGIACIKLNRNFIGTEIDPTYFGIAKKRIEDAEREEKESMALFEGVV